LSGGNQPAGQTEKTLRCRRNQRYRYGFDYRDIFNMDMSYAEWLYSHMRMYKDNSVHDDTMATVTFDGKEYTEDELNEIRQFAEFVKSKRK
jgi:hypothetical protein